MRCDSPGSDPGDPACETAKKKVHGQLGMEDVELSVTMGYARLALDTR